MSLYLVLGLIVATLSLICYLGQAARKKKTPELANALEIILSAVGMVGGFKMLAAIATGEFSHLIKLSEKSADIKLKLSEEDTVFLFIGSIALIWISIQSIARQFQELSQSSQESVSATNPQTITQSPTQPDLTPASTVKENP